jgi:hypothetical protein
VGQLICATIVNRFLLCHALQAANQPYPITEYQPVYYVAESLHDAKEKMRSYCSGLSKVGVKGSLEEVTSPMSKWRRSIHMLCRDSMFAMTRIHKLYPVTGRLCEAITR